MGGIQSTVTPVNTCQGSGKLSFTRVFHNTAGYVDVVVSLYDFDIDAPRPRTSIGDSRPTGLSRR